MAEFGPRHDVLMVLPTYSRTGSSCQASTDSNISTGTDAKPEMPMDEIASQGAVEWQTDEEVGRATAISRPEVPYG